eukprot:Nitzschia sp. Nitz4//scaffold23_size168460//33505//37330//NITZ4_002208-RA/size168460-snap-gene-0.152-mRNA-1//-1//CDS//3329543602//2286//frame0
MPNSSILKHSNSWRAEKALREAEAQDVSVEESSHRPEIRSRTSFSAHGTKDSTHGDFDFAYPSARAMMTRSSLSKRKLLDESEEFIPLNESAPTNGNLRHLPPRVLQRSNSRDGASSTGSGEFSNLCIDFLKDPPNQMTLGRKIALRLQYKKWYNPRAGLDSYQPADEENGDLGSNFNFPSLAKAWAYFEHVTLTRYVVEAHNTNVEDWGPIKKFLYSFKNFNEEFERAQPGENQRPTKLYDSVTTPHMQLGDFGLGFGLYFSTLRAIGYILFFAGCISIFNLYFFASPQYARHSPENTDHEGLKSNPLLYGSAICTNTSWEMCWDCNCSDTTQGWARTSRCATTDDGLTFTIKNNCLQQEGIMRKLGLINFGTIIFLLLAMVALGNYLKKQTIQFDEDEQTAQDYSIVISNPPPRATNPEVWREFFETNFPGVRCAAITCAVNNDLLVRALVARREVLRKMELQLDPGTPMDIDHLALMAAKHARDNHGFFQRFVALFSPRLPELLSQLVALNTSIKGLAQLSYPCTNVFVTFEKESYQRQVLGKLSVGGWHIRRNNTKVVGDPKYLFEGNILEVAESVEPNSVRWQDLNATLQARMDQMTLTSFLTFGAIIAVAYMVQIADSIHTLGAAFCIAGFNLAFPEFAKLIVALEAHPTESKLQMSLYWKICVFRWVNTAIVITVITPFTHTLAVEEGLIPQIFSIFFAEIVTTNAIQLTDLWGHFQRHILAPRANTQDSMNLCFLGLEVELAERYTNMTKIMFLAFWYSSIFPGAMFLAAIALLVNYYTDRWSLMRTWKRSPHVSAEISTYSRRYFFSTACIFLGVMSSFYWAAFPFDNMCVVEDQYVDDVFVGEHNASMSNRNNTESLVTIFVEQNSSVYSFCNQDFILRKTNDFKRFPFFYREGDGEWMDQEQQQLSLLFGWLSVAVMALVGTSFLISLQGWVRGLFKGSYEEPGDEQGIAFHDVRNITGYIPQVRSPIFSYPLIACKCDKIGEQLFDWTDPDRDYTYYDLTKDADHVLSGTNRRAKHSFSRVKHYPPNTRLQDLKKRKRRLEKRIQNSKNLFNSVATIDTGNLSTSLHQQGSSSLFQSIGNMSSTRRRFDQMRQRPSLQQQTINEQSPSKSGSSGNSTLEMNEK